MTLFTLGLFQTILKQRNFRLSWKFLHPIRRCPPGVAPLSVMTCPSHRFLLHLMPRLVLRHAITALSISKRLPQHRLTLP